jgi:hypothetical protein
MALGLQGKVAIVTGSSDGIGYAIAQATGSGRDDRICFENPVLPRAICPCLFALILF